MNSQFYEFWGNFLTHVAQGQKQVEDMSAWMKQGYTGADDLATLFRRAYGLNVPDTGSAQRSASLAGRRCRISERLHPICRPMGMGDPR